MTAQSEERATRVVFMGTPDFAVPALQALIDVPQVDVVGVVTQPDRPAGRGRKLQMPPVKEAALSSGVPVIQPEKRIDKTDAFDQLKAWEPDFLVVVAFGQILRQPVLDVPRVMPVNVHASILPRWRGAAPIQHAIKAGDLYSGVTTMQMDAGMDTGPILLQDSIPIQSDETGQSLHDKLAVLGARLIVQTLQCLVEDFIEPHPQPDSDALVTYAPMLKKAEGEIDWSQPAEVIERHVRAFYPWPGTYTYWDGKRLKIISGNALPHDLKAAPGEVVDIRGTGLDTIGVLAIGTGEGVYIPSELQLAGRNAQNALDFINGAPDIAGARLGPKHPA